MGDSSSSELCVQIEQSFATAVAPSPNVLQTACMFGLGLDEARSIAVVPRTAVPLPQSGVVFVTGPSGGGKSTVLNLIAQQARDRSRHVIDFDALTVAALPNRPLVDVFGLPLRESAALLARAGLGDAFVMLRSPKQLSDGQRYRLRLAMAMHEAEKNSSMRGRGNAAAIIIADEFGATLDRTTAMVIARQVRVWAYRAGCTFIAATTHDDLLEAFEPDVLIVKGLGESIEVVTR